MRLPVPVQRLGYRVAYTLLRTYWFIRRPKLSGVKWEGTVYRIVTVRPVTIDTCYADHHLRSEMICTGHRAESSQMVVR